MVSSSMSASREAPGGRTVDVRPVDATLDLTGLVDANIQPGLPTTTVAVIMFKRYDPYPERHAGGFTRLDGGVQFYVRIHALLESLGRRPVVLDFGAGRGASFDEDDPIRRCLLDLRSKAEKVIGVDIADAVLGNPALTEAHVIAPGGPLPLGDQSVDLVVADHIFEHLADPAIVARELTRVLRPAGWICARTPNRWGYIAVAARAVPNRLHARVLRRVQPSRREEDMFDTVYHLNTPGDIAEHFPVEEYEHIIYGWEPEPSYVANSASATALFRLLGRLTPEALRPMLLVFLRRKVPDAADAG